MADINIPDEGNGPEKGDLKQYVRSDAVQKNENARHDDMGVLLSDDIRRWVRSHAHTFNFADTRRHPPPPQPCRRRWTGEGHRGGVVSVLGTFTTYIN